jgi:hypothetical protein
VDYYDSAPNRADWQSANDYETHCERWRAERWRDESAHVEAWKRSEPYKVRPFRFEDLNGAPDPAAWGPAYPKTASQAVEKWRAIARGRELTAGEASLYGQAVHAWINSLNAPKRAPNTLSTRSNCASGQATEYSAAKHRASLRAAFHAQAAADRLAWASGKAKDARGLTIAQVYARAMKEKRARLAFLADVDAFNAAQPHREAA